jgi:thiol-disulfide isomerase/thioredoxin
MRARGWAWAAAALFLLFPGRGALAQPSLQSLLSPLELVAYSSRATPPGFTGETLGAGRLATSDLRGQVLLLNFWASWCLDCRPEMRVLERLHRDLESRAFSVVGVNAREPAARVQRFAAEMGLTFPIVIDGDGRIGAQHGVVGVPTTILVARDGRAVAVAIGPRAWDGAPARALLDALLAEPAPDSGRR